MDEDKIRQLISEELTARFGYGASKLSLKQHLQMMDGRNIQAGRTTGTKIGTATDQKIGFFGATPVVRQAAPTTLANVISVLQALGLTS
jgi:hypothetical protein